MKNEIQKLEEIVELLKGPEEVVMEKKEITEKLEKIVLLLKDPKEVTLEKEAIKSKLESVVRLVSSTIVDIDVDYCIPEVETTAETCDVSGNPYIMLSYSEDEYTTRKRKVSLGNTALQSTAEDLAKHVLLSIEQFKDEIDTIEMG